MVGQSIEGLEVPRRHLEVDLGGHSELVLWLDFLPQGFSSLSPSHFTFALSVTLLYLSY